MSYAPAQRAIRLAEAEWVDAILFNKFLSNVKNSGRYNLSKDALLNEYAALNKEAPFDVSRRFSAANPDKRFVFLNHQSISGLLGAIFSFLSERNRQSEVLNTKNISDHTDESYRAKQDSYLACVKAAAALQNVILSLDDNTAAVGGVFSQASFESNYGLAFTSAVSAHEAARIAASHPTSAARAKRDTDTTTTDSLIAHINALQSENEKLKQRSGSVSAPTSYIAATGAPANTTTTPVTGTTNTPPSTTAVTKSGTTSPTTN